MNHRGRAGGSVRREAAATRNLEAPLPPARSRTEDLVHRLRQEILSGALAPGARLPTEQRLCERLGVSRTVVREAVAALRADGLVITRQGVGAFVSADAQHRPFRIDAENLTSIARILDLMELRASIETEAAALAAQRRKASHLRELAARLAAFDAALAHGDAAVQADFGFHCAIAEAAGNAFFVDVLHYLGKLVIPRQSIRVLAQTPAAQTAYLRGVQAEHRAIHDAIVARDAPAARAAMLSHLQRSQERYRHMAGASGRRPV